jgi:hypothetical protein
VNKNSGKFIAIEAVLILSAGLFLFPKSCMAAYQDVIINELMWTGSSISTADEWIELKNLSSSHIDFGLTPWSIYRNDSLMLVINKGTLDPGGYFLIANNSKDYIFTNGESILNIDPDLVNSVISLYNSSAQYKLYNTTDDGGEIIDTADDGSGAPLAGENGTIKKSMERNDDPGDGAIASSWHSCYEAKNIDKTAIDCATPRVENSKIPPLTPPPPKIYSKDIRINELMPNPSGTPERDYEFVEIYNYSKDDIDLNGWKIKDKTSQVVLSGTIESKKYKVFYDTVSLNNDGDEIGLYNPDEELVYSAAYSENAKEDQAYAFDGVDWNWTKFPTPNAENIFRVDYPRGVYLNEILPHPSGNEDNEFIELYNNSEKEINLSDWTLKDSSKTSHYFFPKNTIIDPSEFLVVYRKDYKFALNDSGDESVYLFDPNGEDVSSITYTGAKEGVSYNFNGSAWRWSRFLTPGEENKFNNLPISKEKNDKNIYVGVYAEFSAKAKDKNKDKLKFTWDFGDGHKSYKKNTRHKYEKTGRYTVTLKVFDGSEEKIKTFKIKVKKYPQAKVKIIEIVPNPAGIDAKNEYITIKNESDDPVNLKNWSIATGSKKLYNHPISQGLIINDGATFKITKDYSKFTLNNKNAKIELRYPNGKVADKVIYDKGNKTVAENETYQKMKNGWQWMGAKTSVSIKLLSSGEAHPNIQNKEEVIEENFSEFLGGQSMAISLEEKQNELINYGTHIKLASLTMDSKEKVLGAEIVKKDGNRYLFTSGSFGEEHYLIKFLKTAGIEMNSLINRILLVFLK